MDLPMPLESRPVALVTGASSGIGEQFARRYALEGNDLVIVARSAGTLHALAAELSAEHGVTVQVHPADLARNADLAGLVEVIGDLPRLDYLVNSAGVAPEGDLVDTEAEALDQLIALNIGALTALTRAAISRMRRSRKGTIINIGSGAAYQPLPHFAAYAASKAYVVRLTEALSEENRAWGIRIIAVSPGDTDTPMNPGSAKNKRRPEQVVETAWRAVRGTAPSVVDGRMNSFTALLSTRVLPKRAALRIGERMMRDKM